MRRTTLLRLDSGGTVSRNPAKLADLPELWRLPLTRGNSLRRPEEPQIRSKSQIKSLWRKVATFAKDPFEKRHPGDFKFRGRCASATGGERRRGGNHKCAWPGLSCCCRRWPWRAAFPSLIEPGLLLPCERLCLLALSGIFKREIVVCFLVRCGVILIYY
jgi:hypothetical protein